MCGRLACTLNKENLQAAAQYKSNSQWVKPQWASSPYEYKPFYNGPPTTNVAVLADKNHFPDCKLNPDTPEICITVMKWGLMPAVIPEGGLKTLHTHNARYETFSQSPLYKPCLVNGRRCVVLAEGYYEWQTTKGENNKQPYYLYQENAEEEKPWKGKTLVKFAGLFNKTLEDGETKYSCTIITKESDETMSWMHHRMPIILNTQTEVENWLNYRKLKDSEAVKWLSNCKPDEKFEVKYYAVDKLVNKSTFDDKKCMEPLTLKRKSTFLSSWLQKKPKV